MNSEDAKTGRAEGGRQTTSRLKASGPLPAFLASLFISLMCLMVLCVPTAGASALHKNAVVKEYDQVFTTYPYSDPDPVPAMSRFCPREPQSYPR